MSNRALGVALFVVISLELLAGFLHCENADYFLMLNALNFIFDIWACIRLMNMD